MAEELEGLPVPGYRPQTQGNLSLVAHNKEVEELVLRVLDGLAAIPEVDKRWLSIARTDIEKGFMAMNRAVFKPTRAEL